MTTKQGKDLQVGDKVFRRESGEAMTIKLLSRGICRGSRIAEYDRTDAWGRLWGSIFDNTEYEVESDKPRKGETK